MGSLVGKLRRGILETVYTRPVDISPAQPLFSFTFDDVPRSAAVLGGEILTAAGGSGTYYVAGSMVSPDSAPTARDPDEPHPMVNVPDLLALQRGHHDVQCHTWGHLDLYRTTATVAVGDCQRNRDWLSTTLATEPARHFAYPFGNVSPWVKRRLRDEYLTLRTVDWGINRGRCDASHLRALSLCSVDFDRDRLLNALDDAVARPGWVLLFTHEVDDAAGPWGTRPDDLYWVVQECLKRGRICSVSEAWAEISPT